ncbi:SAM-dependent methyltransferase [Acinetobacter boissieri]|uniref:Methyltransferase domain-containing protein n=1 Tax=Acinetobacter boissieri TaxID=1219383 RepID=A0A1G6GJ49_9GAMM|nr:class I SAM-dependent methyltransferase [Acinetobacter boissieri]SDB81949.1 Methyltransferase domain-containing protein [Acinetobacter boissieri]
MHKLPQFRWALAHKYAIDASQLGDTETCAWTNLGLWHSKNQSYVQACEQLAINLANQLQVCKTDHLLDLGCGQGASLFFWQRYYSVQQITAVELQADCVRNIQNRCQDIQVYHSSFLSLDCLKQKYDVIVCIDALYHSGLSDFFKAIAHVVKPNTRVGFHHLLLNERWQQQTWLQKKTYQYLLKVANVQFKHIETATTLQCMVQSQGYNDLNIQVLSQDVFAGFAHYVEHLPAEKLKGLSGLKIKMTAKLCQKLYQDGLIDYVQVTVSKD